MKLQTIDGSPSKVSKDVGRNLRVHHGSKALIPCKVSGQRLEEEETEREGGRTREEAENENDD